MENNRTLKALHRIADIQEKILEQLMQGRGDPVPDYMLNLIDNTDVKAMLKISDSTLYRIKRKRIISAIRIGKRDYYNLTEIQNLVKYYLK